ncbi:spore germination protein GerPE [Salipaludibacillus sp. HK11]|uniref:spore germination protein GerPE n=1 Tax=Salipaludibacillus sp. HK11 TaxID=3394320 RepID=UPI0039FB972F
MYKRTSIVKTIKVRDVLSNSIFEVGDTRHITPRTKVLAVQRKYEQFYSDEGNLDAFPIFTKPLPEPTINRSVNFNKYNESFIINVNHIDVISVSTSSVLHIGSTETINAEARIKHIRQLLNDSDGRSGTSTSDVGEASGVRADPDEKEK